MIKSYLSKGGGTDLTKIFIIVKSLMVYVNDMLLGFYFRKHYLLPNLSQKWARANCKKELPSKK